MCSELEAQREIEFGATIAVGDGFADGVVELSILVNEFRRGSFG